MEVESLSGIKWYVRSMIEISEELVMKHEKMGSLQLKMEHITLRIPKGVSSPAESVMLFFAPIFFKGANLHFFSLNDFTCGL